MSKRKPNIPCGKCDKSMNIGGIIVPDLHNLKECNNCEDYKEYRKYTRSRIFSKKNIKEYERVLYCIEHCIDSESED